MDLDRGINTIIDGYCTQEELERICALGLLDGSIEAMRTRVLKFEVGLIFNFPLNVITRR
jgi:hypothetical protein